MKRSNERNFFTRNFERKYSIPHRDDTRQKSAKTNFFTGLRMRLPLQFWTYLLIILVVFDKTKKFPVNHSIGYNMLQYISEGRKYHDVFDVL